jgi:hypothetical protein
MPPTDTRSLQQIKRDTEQTRAGLSDTVEQLKTSVAGTASDIRQRISPEAIKAEVSGYIKSRGEQLLNDVTAAARRNPMQAVAVGASMAYPLLRLARAIPVPVLMVGAGLFFAGSKSGQAATQTASDVVGDVSSQVVRQAREFGDRVQETAAAASTYAADQVDRVTAAMSGGADQVRRAGEATGAAVASSSQRIRDSAASAGAALSDRAHSLKDDDGLRIAGSAASAVQDMASGATAATRNTASSLADTGMEAARTIKDQASDASEWAGKTFFQTIEQNPLLVAGVGLLVGGLIASALPRSEFEDGLVGDASTAAKRQVQASASKGFDAVKGAVGEIYDETARQAEAEGLTTDALGNAAQDITQRVRRVADAAVTTAFEPSKPDHQTNAHGENDHG